MLKTLESTESLTHPRKSGVGVGGDSRARGDNSKLDGSGIVDDEVDNKVNDEVGKKD